MLKKQTESGGYRTRRNNMIESIKERRLKAIYEFSRTTSGKDDLLDFLLAIVSHRQIKQACEELGIEIK
jgi:hypothetical protein